MTSNSKLKDINSPQIQNLLSIRPFYDIRLNNGERVYGPPINGALEKPMAGSEVYVYRIPNDSSEDELVPFFEMVGLIYQLRIKINFSGEGRGYAYVMYSDPFTANRAVRQLNQLTLRPGIRLKVDLSFDNKRLRIEKISANKIVRVMTLIGEGIVDHTYTPITKVLTLKYASHYWASKARRVFYQSPFKFVYQLEWVSPEEQNREITSIWIRNLRLSANPEELKSAFSFERTVVKSVSFKEDLILVRYVTRNQAEFAFKVLIYLSERNGYEICWASD